MAQTDKLSIAVVKVEECLFNSVDASRNPYYNSLALFSRLFFSPWTLCSQRVRNTKINELIFVVLNEDRFLDTSPTTYILVKPTWKNSHVWKKYFPT